MIVAPKNQMEWGSMMQFLTHYTGVSPTMDTQLLGWVVNDDLKVVVGFNGFLGKICQMHVAMQPDFKFSPRELLKQSFKHAYTVRKCDMVLGIVNSFNHDAMRYDAHLGFKELWRLPKMHEEGGDLVVLGMTRAECKYLHDVVPEERVA